MKAKLSGSSSAGKSRPQERQHLAPSSTGQAVMSQTGVSDSSRPAGANGPAAADQRQSLPPLTPEEMRKQYAGAWRRMAALQVLSAGYQAAGQICGRGSWPIGSSLASARQLPRVCGRSSDSRHLIMASAVLLRAPYTQQPLGRQP